MWLSRLFADNKQGSLPPISLFAPPRSLSAHPSLQLRKNHRHFPKPAARWVNNNQEQVHAAAIFFVVFGVSRGKQRIRGAWRPPSPPSIRRRNHTHVLHDASLGVEGGVGLGSNAHHDVADAARLSLKACDRLECLTNTKT